MSAYYQISWSSVDGAGSNDEQIADKESAIARASAIQDDCEIEGNPWSYTYRVTRRYTTSCRRDDVYNARTKVFY